MIQLKQIFTRSKKQELRHNIKDSFLSAVSIEKDGKTINWESHPVKKGKIFQVSDILFSNIRPWYRKIVFADREGICSTDIEVIRSNANIKAKFLFYLLYSRRFMKFFHTNIKGSAIPRLDWATIEKNEFNFPSLSLQQQIIAIIEPFEEMEQIISQIQKTIAELSNLLWIKVTKRRNWPSEKLGKIAEIVAGKVNVGNLSSEGKYHFFSCSSERDLKTDHAPFEGNYTILGGNANIFCRYFMGKFGLYQRTYALKTRDGKNSSSLFFSVKNQLLKIFSFSNGSVIKYITLQELNKLTINKISSDLDFYLENLLSFEIYAENLLKINKNIKEKLIKKLIY